MLEDLTKQIEVFTYLFDSKHHDHLLSKGEHAILSTYPIRDY